MKERQKERKKERKKERISKIDFNVFMSSSCKAELWSISGAIKIKEILNFKQ